LQYYTYIYIYIYSFIAKVRAATKAHIIIQYFNVDIVAK